MLMFEELSNLQKSLFAREFNDPLNPVVPTSFKRAIDIIMP